MCSTTRRFAALCWALAWAPMTAQSTSVQAAETGAPAATEVHPLGLKEEMIRDRFQRFEDRVFRLREQVEESEPENASRLGRVLQRAGELGLSESLEELIELFKGASTLEQAHGAQTQWLVDADRLLAILLERDSENEERKAELERLQAYQEQVQKLLEQERSLRDATAQAAMAARMLQQLDQAIARVQALMTRQAKLEEATDKIAQAGRPADKELSEKQKSLSRDAEQLAEDLKRLGDLKPEEAADSPSQQSARNKTKAASKSVKSGAGAMSQAAEKLEDSKAQAAGPSQEQAMEALQRAKEQLEEAKRELEDHAESDELGTKQEDVAKKTGALSEEMKKNPVSPSGKSQSGQQKGSSSPGQQSLEKAQGEMKKAAESLDQSKPDEATPKQDKAIKELEQVQKELEEALNQLRKEERAETLRDLEDRFRELASKQRAINEATVRLDELGRETFQRAERLQLADLSTQERDLSREAAKCVHILDEDGTTVVVPRVMGQISQDMATVAQRLAALDVGVLTRTIEREIVEALEQLLEAVQKMQQANEQGGNPAPSSSSDQQSPLLPQSAELKLLRSSQVRVNTRTTAIEETRVETADGDVKEALAKVGERQAECAEMAEEMRSRQLQP